MTYLIFVLPVLFQTPLFHRCYTLTDQDVLKGKLRQVKVIDTRHFSHGDGPENSDIKVSNPL